MLSGLNIILRSVDADAAAFGRRSGAEDKRAISAFVRGVKGLGLWEQMVCWPLRSTQNAGTGTTAFSLGGLGTYDGTLTNGPTWGSDGVVFTAASSQRITLTGTEAALHPETNPFWVAAVVNSPGSLASASTVFARGQNNTLANASWALRHTNANRGEWQVTNGTTQVIPVFGATLPANTPGYLVGSYDKVTAKISQDGGTEVTSAYTETVQNSAQPATIGSAFSVNYYNGTVAFALYSLRDIAQVLALYKSTLGQGLGLP